MGLAAYSNKIPRKPQFTGPHGLHGAIDGHNKARRSGGKGGRDGGSLGAQLGMARYFEGVGDVESNAIDCLDSARLRLGNMLQ